MLNRKLKAAYFAVLHYPMRANALRHRVIPKKYESLKVQLGPGQMNYMQGWINVDANFLSSKIDIWSDISAKLPFRSSITDAFYSHHVIEHLADSALPFHFSEMFRCLKPGGVIRVGGPNADMAIRKFEEHDLEWFSDFPDTRQSIGGRFANFLLCKGEHQTILTSSYLKELADAVGFEGVDFCNPRRDTHFPSVFDDEVLSKEWESTPDFPHTLIMEARKPLSSLQ